MWGPTIGRGPTLKAQPLEARPNVLLDQAPDGVDDRPRLIAVVYRTRVRRAAFRVHKMGSDPVTERDTATAIPPRPDGGPV